MTALAAIATALRASRGLAAKADIAAITQRLGLADAAVRSGDDCAAIPDGDAFLLFAIEGFINEFVAADPWFAGWCGVMVNISDVAAMGGRAIAVVDALWSAGAAGAAEILAGMRAAAAAYGIPIVGGHTNTRSAQGQLAVAILGRAAKLLTSFDARAGEILIAAIDLRGRYREPFDNWEAATTAPPERLRANLALLPRIAELGLSRAAKDISQAGIIGTAAMLAECSGIAMNIDITAIPCPANAPLQRWLLSFPSFGYLLTATPENAASIIALFNAQDIAAAAIGSIRAGTTVTITDGTACETIWDFAQTALTGCAARAAA
jgi:AIR synthase-related protein